MSERTYTTIDKTGWGDGPWQDEPDKVQWVDGATGLGVPPGHEAHGKEYDAVRVAQRDPDDEFWDWPDAHGGLTFAAKCQEGSPEAEGICHVPGPGQPDDVWWLGFDCAHLGDLSPGSSIDREVPMPGESYKPLPYVRRETASLAAQLGGGENLAASL